MRSKPTYDVTFDYSLYLWKFEEFWSSFHAKIWLKKKVHTKRLEERGKKKWCGVLHLISSRGESKRAEKEAHHSKPQKENETFWTLVEVQGVKLLGEDSLWQELSASKIEWFPLSPILFTINFPSKNFSINSSIGFETLESLEFFENLLVMIYNL